MLALAALHALAISLLVPPWMGEDEPWHLETALRVAHGDRPDLDLVPPDAIPPEPLRAPISHLQLARRFPRAPLEELARGEAELLRSMADERFDGRVDWAPDVRGTTSFDAVHPAITAAAQPPLYATLLGLWLMPFRSLPVETQLRVARIPSALVYVLAVWTALRLGQHLARDPRLAVLAGATCALWPMHARQAAVVNNDVLAKAVVSLAVLLALGLVGRRTPLARRGRFALLLAAAPFAKSTAVSAFVLAPMALFGGRRASRRMVRTAFLGLIVALLLAGGFALALATNPALPGGLGEFVQRVRWSWSPDRLANLGRTLVGVFGWYQRTLPAPVYDLATIIGALGGAGLFAWATRRARAARRATRAGAGAEHSEPLASLVEARVLDRRGAPTVLLGVVALVAAQATLVALRGESAGRYLFPAAAPLATLVALGWLVALPARMRDASARALVALLLVLDASFLVLGLFGEEWLRFAA